MTKNRKCKWTACKVEFDDPSKWNEYNINKHESACKHRLINNIQTINRFTVPINIEIPNPTSAMNIPTPPCSSNNSNECQNAHANKRPRHDDEFEIIHEYNLEEKKIQKCNGYKPEIIDIYFNYPFQLLEIDKDKIQYVLENGVFHHNSCAKDGYILNNPNELTNQLCQNLIYNQHLNTIIKRFNCAEKHTNYNYLTFNQLKELLDYKNQQINNLKLENLNKLRSIISLRNKTNDFKRFMILISQNQIPRLHQIIRISINNGFGINGIIEKIKNAIENVYHPRGYSKTEYDLAAITLRIGGPRLLYAFNQLNYLPSSSSMYKQLKSSINLDISNYTDLDAKIKHNIKQYYTNCRGAFGIKIEFRINQKLRWNCNSNEIVGLCYNHKCCLQSVQFDSWLVLNEIKAQLDSNNIHIATEALIISIGQISAGDIIPKPILIIPICNHTNTCMLNEILPKIVDGFKELNPASKLVNLATDGDPNRRKVLNSMRMPNLSLPALRELKFFDQNLFLGNMSINYDPKHLLKRLNQSFQYDFKFVNVNFY